MKIKHLTIFIFLLIVTNIFCSDQKPLFLTIYEVKDNSNDTINKFPIDRNSSGKDLIIDGFNNIKIHIENSERSELSSKRYIKKYSLLLYESRNSNLFPALIKSTIVDTIKDDSDIFIQLDTLAMEQYVFQLIIEYHEDKVNRLTDTITIKKKFERIRVLFNVPSSIPNSESFWDGLLQTGSKTQLNISWMNNDEYRSKFTSIFHIPAIRYESRGLLNEFELGFALPVNLTDDSKETILGYGLSLGFWRTEEDRTLIQFGLFSHKPEPIFFIGIEIPTLIQKISEWAKAHS